MSTNEKTNSLTYKLNYLEENRIEFKLLSQTKNVNKMKKLSDMGTMSKHLTTQKASPHTPLLDPPPLLALNGGENRK